ncbi:MAG: prenyltransferase/squalene oxidase repeat-containing protein [Acidobacteriota bacterium]
MRSQAARFLWAQQAEDGGFHSQTYGLLRSGQSLTPLVLGALLGVPATVLPPPRGAVDRALEFLKKNTTQDGVVGRMGDSVDYPNYATALALTVIVKARRRDYEREIAPIAAQLRTQQFSEANGWKREEAPYGGWGIGGALHVPPEAGHVDLSMTRYVMEALAASGVPPSDAVMTRALVYLDRSRNADGGFYFSPVNADTNKAGEAKDGFASYGTTTADGLLALRAAGIPDTDERIASGVRWLRAHHQPDRAPGFDLEPYQTWASGLRFYYADVISRVLPDLPVSLPPQEADGSFRNANNLVKEDDPLIATSFAVNALSQR